MGYYSQNSNLIGVAPRNRTGVHDLVNSQVNWDIVPDDLYLHLDAGREESYPGTGATWYDLSGNGFDATVYGNISWGFSPVDQVDSKFFFLPGTSNDAKISLGNTLDFGNEFTICALIRPLSDSNIQPLICNVDPGPTTEGFFFGWNTWGTSDRKVRVLVGQGTGSDNKHSVWSDADAFSVTPPEWCFFTVTIGKTVSEAHVRLNMSTIIDSADLDDMDFDVSGQDVTIGAFNSVQAAVGTSYPACCHISAIAVYKRFLTYHEQIHNFNYYKRRFGGGWA